MPVTLVVPGASCRGSSSTTGCTCRDRQGTGLHHINAVHREGVELLVWPPQEFVLEQIATLAVELKESHVLLHGDICGEEHSSA